MLAIPGDMLAIHGDMLAKTHQGHNFGGISGVDFSERGGGVGGGGGGFLP